MNIIENGKTLTAVSDVMVWRILSYRKGLMFDIQPTQMDNRFSATYLTLTESVLNQRFESLLTCNTFLLLVRTMKLLLVW
jgi:hypothetical protein